MLLEARELVKHHGGRTALDRVSFSIGAGEIVGFLGVNGAGKSTAMRILSGFTAPTAGQARIAGFDPRLAKARERIGYLPEANPLPPRRRVGEYLNFRAGVKGLAGAARRRAVREAAARCRVDGFLDRLIGGLSKGMRQRVGLADSLLASPDLLILDEPTSGLDPAQAEETRGLMAGLADRGAAVFLSSHILHDIERLCRRVIVLDRGRVAADGALRDICGEYAGERILRLEMEAAGPVLETLLAVPGVAGGEVEPHPPGAGLVVRLTLAAGADARREAALAALRQGWLITEMRLEPIRLEDVFRRLVLNEPAADGTGHG
ncbi:MAG: ABC transporter ATP-binding protein [Planctomycetota bacterium]|jgi:ABC-2 type transport system ATP-binding protein|nr:ABC transporter ATP-binding protein [Planctomycetota bacterium]